jgi:class 3 adenylate cyclase/YHS domain-containing protein
MAEPLSLEDLSRRTGEPKERLEDWRSRGLIGRGADGTFTMQDLEAARLVQMCLRRGVSIDAIAEAERKHGMIERYFDLVPGRRAGPSYSVAEAAEASGVELDTARKLWSLIGGTGAPDEALRDEDVEALRTFGTLLSVGFPLEALVEGGRVYLDSLSRVAEMEAKLFHFNVHGRLKAQGLSGRALENAVASASESAVSTIEPTVLYFHRKGWEQAMREDIVMHIAEEAGLPVFGETAGEMTRAVMFVDLASFTPMTEAMGDAQAAQVLERFSAIVRDAAGRWDGRIVKQIGDAFMLVFHEPRSALASALEIEQRTSVEPQFPAARSGIHWGNVLYREGDYIGANVNIASRLSTDAERHQVLVTAEVRKECRDLPGVEFARIGKRRLKGLPAGLELFAASAPATPAGGKVVDPVCGMEMSEPEIAARLALDGVQRAFCSEECLRRFVVSPASYSG